MSWPGLEGLCGSLFKEGAGVDRIPGLQSPVNSRRSPDILQEQNRFPVGIRRRSQVSRPGFGERNGRRS